LLFDILKSGALPVLAEEIGLDLAVGGCDNFGFDFLLDQFFGGNPAFLGFGEPASGGSNFERRALGLILLGAQLHYLWGQARPAIPARRRADGDGGDRMRNGIRRTLAEGGKKTPDTRMRLIVRFS
jgi:hypothetical protein